MPSALRVPLILALLFGYALKVNVNVPPSCDYISVGG